MTAFQVQVVVNGDRRIYFTVADDLDEAVRWIISGLKKHVIAIDEIRAVGCSELFGTVAVPEIHGGVVPIL